MRPVLRKKKTTKRPRQLSPLQRLIVAKEMAAGTPLKQVADRWRISRSYVHRIFDEHLRHEIVWKESHREEA
jgi:AraC-like DNA-binding protein